MLVAKGGLESLMNSPHIHSLHIFTESLFLDTKAARSVSPTLKLTGAVDIATVELSLDFWRKSDFVN